MQALLKQIRQLQPKLEIITSPALMKPFECDGLSAYQSLPQAVFLPDNKQQLIDLVKACYQHKIPIVSRGAGTGLSGGALPCENGVLISLSKMKRILEINPSSLTARVQPGVRNIEVSQAVAAFGLFYAPDPSSQIACTIGGNVAENSGGVHCLKYGLTLHNVQSLEMLTMKGELLQIGGDTPDAPGADLLPLLIGSEGLLGIFTEITLKLKPKPSHTQVLMAAFANVANAANAVSDIIASGIIPAGLEMMDKLAIEAAEAFVHAGYPLDAEVILIAELDGSDKEITKHLAGIEPLLQQNQCTQIKIAQNRQQADTIWQGRKSAFPAVGRLSPDYYCMDGTIPKSQLAYVLEQIQQLSKKYGLAVANVFHAGDGNLHPLILYDANNAEQLQQAEAFGAEILQLSVQVAGTITGEHGVGMEKIDQMCDQFSQEELAQFHRVRRVFDEDKLLNPEKAIPELHRCAELGAMHVHHGELPFPELDRF